MWQQRTKKWGFYVKQALQSFPDLRQINNSVIVQLFAERLQNIVLGNDVVIAGIILG